MDKEIRNNQILSITDSALLGSHSDFLKEDQKYHDAFKGLTDEGVLVYPRSEKASEGSIAYHPIFGPVYYSSWWRFSTEDFIEDLKAAEANPAIGAHLLHIDSPGGEVFFVHEAFEAVKALTKPCIALIDSCGASAAYWIACAADKIYASSIFSNVGSIGVMSTFYDDREAMKKWGVKEVELYSSYSDLKNKIYKDVLDGKVEEFIKTRLDPLAKQFIDDVCSVRSITEDSEALRGKIYYAMNAMPEGLIDGRNTLEEVIAELQNLMPAPADEPTIDINNLKIQL